MGGCCSQSYDDVFDWNQAYIMNAIVSTPPSNASPTPCADIHADPSFVDELPVLICADMLAQDECEIPVIRARCNFTCTGCTAAPVIPPTQAPTSHRAAVPFAPESATVTEVYRSNGTIQVTNAVLQEVCDEMPPAGAAMIEVVMWRCSETSVFLGQSPI